MGVVDHKASSARSDTCLAAESENFEFSDYISVF